MKKEVLRKCVSCRKQFDKKHLYRLVRTVDGSIVLDPTHKLNGRGAYVSKHEECVNDKKLKFKLQQALKTKISDEDFSTLMVQMTKGVNYGEN
ncbi:MAG: YlxR family protein [Tissierellia bacterium]|nr:YlxR family protein [Tissierellia bacterium]